MKNIFYSFLFLAIFGTANAGEIQGMDTIVKKAISGTITSWAITNCPKSQQACLQLTTSKSKVYVVIDNYIKDHYIDPVQLGISLVNVQNIELQCELQFTPENDSFCVSNKIKIVGGE